jgi:secreted trypsin-like serine protease
MDFRLCLLLASSAAAVAGSPLYHSDTPRPFPLLTTYGNPNSPRYLTGATSQFDGVALLTIESVEGVAGCTGALLGSGVHVLTAAHCLADSSGTPHVLSLSAAFHTSGGGAPEIIDFAEVKPHPEFTGSLREGNDIGLVVLSRPPSAAVRRYEIYTGAGEIGSEYEVSGFGAAGSGGIESDGEGRRRRGWNTFDATMANTFGQFPGWTAGDGVLVSDFDNGLAGNDALGVFYDIHDLGLGEREVSMAPGDSGAPAFIDGRIAGIASFRLRLTFTDGSTSDVDDISNASFGEFNAFTRVSTHSLWIEPVPEPGTAALCFAAFVLAGARWLRRLSRPAWRPLRP